MNLKKQDRSRVRTPEDVQRRSNAREVEIQKEKIRNLERVIIIDSELSETSENVVSNKTITIALNSKISSKEATQIITDLLNSIVDSILEDKLQEIKKSVEANKESISKKIDISAVVDNLETIDSNKVLSANQGVELKKLIDALDSKIKQINGESEEI